MEYAFVLQTYQIIIPVIQHTLPERFLGKDCKGQKKKKGTACLFGFCFLGYLGVSNWMIFYKEFASFGQPRHRG